MNEQFKKKAIKGFKWNFIDRILGQGVNFILMLIIARLVSPADYGLLAIIMVFVTLSNTFVDCGFSNALIRTCCKNEVDNSTVFYFNILFSIVIYFILFFLSKYIALFYAKSELELLIKCSSIVVVINSLGLVQQAILTSRIDFKTQTIVSFLSALVSGVVGIVLAYYGYKIWALIAQIITMVTIRVILLWIVVSWRPLLLFSLQSFKILFGYSVKILASELLLNFTGEFNNLIIGRYYSQTQLGYYSYASKMSGFPASVISSMVQRVTFPVFSNIKDEEQLLISNFKRMQGLIYFIASPIMLCISVLSEPLINVFLTDKWLPTAQLLTILAIALSLWPLIMAYKNLLYVKGRSDYEFKLQLFGSIMKVSAVIFISQYSLIIFCYVYSLISFVDTLLYGFVISRCVGYKLIDQFKNIHKISLISITSFLIVKTTILQYVSHDMYAILLGGMLYMLIYVLIAYIVKLNELKTIIFILKTTFLKQ